MQFTCNNSCKTAGRCGCGAIKDDALVDSVTLRVPMFLADGTPQARKDLTMMTDAEIMDMKASVRGMPLSKAKDLPIYDSFKGLWTDGRPANEMRALYDGAVDGISPGSDQVSRVEATRDHMIDSMRNEHRRPVNDNNPHGDVA